jgi:molybdate transport system substrate-binding protein
MKRLVIGLLLNLLSLYGAPSAAESLTVAVAANVQFAFNDLKTAFTKETGIEVESIVGSSGKIAAQVKGGAPFDVFLSADMDYPHTLYKDGLAAGLPAIYAYGTLVLWTFADLDLAAGLEVLGNNRVRKIALPNPRLAPYGREAMRALAHYKLDNAVRSKLVLGESIAQVNQYIDSRAVDAGFTAKSVVLSPALRGRGRWIDVPKNSYTPIAQGVVILKHGQDTHPTAAGRFVRYLSSAPARTILERYGYGLP